MEGVHENVLRPRAREVAETLHQIDEPQAYACTVMGYMRSHRQLFVSASKRLPQTETTHELYLWSEAVVFFEGPMSWRGLDFRLGSCEERRALVAGGWAPIGDENIDAFANHHLLLILERPAYRVRICAGNCGVEEQVPPDVLPMFTRGMPSWIEVRCTPQSGE
jgi:hypothetical protein